MGCFAAVASADGVRSEAARRTTHVGRTVDIGTESERRRECSVKKVKSLLKITHRAVLSQSIMSLGWMVCRVRSQPSQPDSA